MATANKSVSTAQGGGEFSSEAGISSTPASLHSSSPAESHVPLQSIQLNSDLPNLDQGSVDTLIDKFRSGLKVSVQAAVLVPHLTKA